MSQKKITYIKLLHQLEKKDEDQTTRGKGRYTERRI